MKKIFTLITIIFIAITVKAQEPNFEWGKQIGGSGYSTGRTINTDSNGNIYITGYFSGTTDFNPNTEIENLSSNGLNDIFIQKLDPEGNFIWVKQIGGVSTDIAHFLTIDSNDDIYITGYFEDIVDFDPNTGVQNLTSDDNSDIFILKLDLNGNFIWVKKMGGNNYQTGISMAIDSNNNIYTLGNFEGTVDLNPNSGTQYFSSNGMFDIFLQKLDTNGEFIWAKQIGGNNNDEGKALTIDSNDNIYATGLFEGTVDFNPNSGTHILNALGNEDAYILKLDSNGNYQWTKQIGGNNMERGISIITDNEDNIYTTGHFGETVDFDPNTGVQNLTSFGGFDVFIQKLNSDGNYIWAKQIGGTTTEVGLSLTTDINNNIYTTGYFSNTADFDPSSAVNNLTSAGSFDVFIQKLNSEGNFIWAKEIGGTGFDVGQFITTNITGDILTTGNFSGTVDIDTSTEVQNFISSGSSDFYIVKLTDDSLSISENIIDNFFKAFPNPTNEKITLAFNSILKNIEIEIFDTQGRTLHSSEYHNTNLVDLKINNASGMYFILIKTPEYEKRISIIKK